jgi:CHAT domain-containing protein
LKRFVFISFLLIHLQPVNIVAQNVDVYNFFLQFNKLYTSGDLINAEKCMLNVLNPANNSPSGYQYGAFNNLGLVKKSLGLYTEALSYYDKAESMILNDKSFSAGLATIYNNKARIYTFRRSFSTAIEFLEKSLRIYQRIIKPDKKVLLEISGAYLNLGIVYYESGDYKEALKNLKESLRLKVKYNLPEIELTYLNLAKVYAKTGDVRNAEEFFTKSIKSMINQFGENYYRIPEVYFGYGTFLNEIGSTQKALNAHSEALRICLENYGEKHSLVSLSYKQIADFYLSHSEYLISLKYYQKALIAVVKNFNDTSICSNPSIDSSLFNIRLLENLKSKAAALELFSGVQNDPSQKLNLLNKSLETIELALQLIDRIRNDYPTEESRIYLAENEKETYMSAVHIAKALYDLTGDKTFISRMYLIVSKAKAVVLRNEISGNELLLSAGVPDSLNKKITSLSLNIAAYNNLLLEESQKKEPDSNKLALWKDALFEMNREKERISTTINYEFPQIKDLLLKTEPLPLAEIQSKLRRDETIIDYLLSNEYDKGKRNLYAFIITRDKIEFFQTGLDSLFIKNAQIIRKHCEGNRNNDFNEFIGALYYMYKNLVKPAEGLFSGNILIIIPDEEIARLPFDAFLQQVPGPDQSDYEGLSYMIRKYIVSYSFSSSLISGRSENHVKGEKMYAFSPDYSRSPSVMPQEFLYGAGKEIESIFKLFRGTKFTGTLATESNFRKAVKDRALFHLAMHSLTDTLNSRYSWLAFDTEADTVEDGRLHNYEISLMRIESPMVVLSACNSGTGTLYHGEGLMSMARSFILAGASSVVRTSWEINDETSAGIITSFYHHLSKGMCKNKALQEAKLGYIEESTPALSDPYYWAAYEIVGDNSPVADKNTGIVILIIAVAVIACSVALYSRRRRIFSARSE